MKRKPEKVERRTSKQNVDKDEIKIDTWYVIMFAKLVEAYAA